MAGYVNNPELWRLHSNNGIVPLKFLDIDGDFDPESGHINFKCLIYSSDILQFLTETFPPPIQVGNMLVPQSAALPGLPGMTATKVSFRSQDSGKPIDPFGFDTGAGSKTYNKLIEVTVEYGLNKLQQPDPNDPQTFLEISCQAKGEYIAMATASGGGKVQAETPAPTNPADDDIPGNANQPKEANTKGAKSVLKNKASSYKVLCPLTEWTVKWPQVSFQYFRDILIYRLRWAEGHINATPLPWLFYAEPETVLFEGYSMQQQYTWREGQLGTPPCSVEMKFTEKRVMWKGLVCGHNHVWVPGRGWMYYLVDGVNPMYETRELNGLFRV